MRPIAVAAALSLANAAVSPLAAQGGVWTPPQAPCDVQPGHFQVSSAVVYLKTAYQKPEQRDRMLAQTVEVLTRAITTARQEKNPGAWYYLGRYYVEMGDAAGADSAFARAEALAPSCAKDITGYRGQLASTALAEGMRTWQEDKIDSAVAFLRLAHRLAPTNPKSLFQLGSLFAARDQMDSATAVLHEAIRVAGTDTAYAVERKEALAGVARSSLRRAQTSPAVQQWQRARYSRDSLGRGITHDSLILARMQASAASRRTRGARLSPADQRTFSADSAARAQALAQGQAARVQLTERVGRDSAAVEAALSPAIAAYRDYLATYPTDLEAVTTLSALYSQNGRPTAAAATFDTFFTHSGEIDPEVLFEAGQRLLAGNLLTPSIKAFTLGLERNPWNRNALSSLATAYLGLRDTSNALATTRRLVGLEPLSRSTLRQHATALDLRGRRDSAQRYSVLADSTLPVDVTVGSFVPDSGGYVLTGIATNLRSTASQPLRLTFEFLDATGGTRASQTTEIPAIAGTQSYQFQVRVSGTGIVGWRYRPS